MLDECCDINDEGDIELSFPNLGQPGKTYRVDVRLALLIDGDGTAGDQGVVDYTAMLVVGQKMIVHGGWFRTAIQKHGLEGQNNFDVMVKDVVVSDPENEYRVVRVLGNKNQVDNNRIPPGQANRKIKLSKAPSVGEVSVSDDMRQGKNPKDNKTDRPGNLRNLQSGKKFLVHGCCSTDTAFPDADFNNHVRFQDPDTSSPVASSWSHHTFAQKIDRFADNNGITSCGCVAHSQGGAACLTLYTYYWSCLDNGSGNRMIQSVGTPYQGSGLSGNLAELGAVFGEGCGYNGDLTHSGASTWLAGIPYWARSNVHYYTTSFETKWWRYDYCHLVSDVFLGDPDDGAVAREKGQLPGGWNQGHKEGWCHSSNMRDPHQATDSNRNEIMDTNAYQ